MDKLRKRALGLVVAAGTGVAAASAGAEPSAATATDPASRVDSLLAELARPEQPDWERIEADIAREWSRSGSATMDLLLRRGRDALDAEDWQAAVEHFSALIDHAPDFAEGHHARATAFYMMGEYALAIGDIESALRLEPRHFAAIAGLGTMLEAMGDYPLALEANRMALELNPHRPEVVRAVERLERRIGGAEL